MKYSVKLTEDATDAYYWCIETIGQRCDGWDLSFSKGTATFKFANSDTCLLFTLKFG